MHGYTSYHSAFTLFTVTKMTKVDLVGVGLNATDTLIPLSHYPAPGTKASFRSTTTLPGGQVASTVVACQHWGLRTRYVGKLGDDEAAALHRREFAREAVETQIITVPEAASLQSLILLDNNGERTVLNRRDERLALRPNDLNREWIVNARALHVDGYDTATATLAAQWAREAGVPVIADLDELYPGVEALIENIDYLIVSRDFPSRLVEEDNLELALRQIHHRYKCRLTAATLGENGVLAWDGQQFHYTPAFNVPVVDTTGAGDIFHAGFIYGLLQEWPLDRQLDFACAAAALNCTAIGARGGIQRVKAIENLIANGTKHPSVYQPHELSS
ncbi:MAG TPA: PfkB family carbohydrate kinase [Pseudacidobacterium sp.]|jgi:sulfofructose kinase|nr:PfkB family carbohydrate kinase [Pseudacidobacterium sp.]